MSQQPSSPAGSGGDDYPDYLWPGEDTGAAPIEWPGLAAGAPAPAGGPRRRFRLDVMAAVIMVAALAGVGIALAVQVFSGSPSSSASPGSHGSTLVPGRSGSNINPGGQVSGPGGGGGSLFIGGRVLAVSSGSITIGGPGHTVTASVTSATKITGNVTSISGIKVGDQVSAQISQQGGKLTAMAIQYPAQAPSFGGPGG
jgi:hypothetical protein